MQATVGKFWTLSSQCWLEDNPQFCSSDHRKEWINEIEEPKTTVGVLGNAGVGKESVELYKSHGLVDWTLFCRFDLLLLVVILAECTSRWSGSASHVRFAWVYCCSSRASLYYRHGRGKRGERGERQSFRLLWRGAIHNMTRMGNWIESSCWWVQ